VSFTALTESRRFFTKIPEGRVLVKRSWVALSANSFVDACGLLVITPPKDGCFALIFLPLPSEMPFWFVFHQGQKIRQRKKSISSIFSGSIEAGERYQNALPFPHKKA
jgi:hypothetical protein